MHSARSTEYEKACFGMGCFWCAEAIFRTVPGLQAFQVGYMGGAVPIQIIVAYVRGLPGMLRCYTSEYSSGAARYAQLVQLFLQSHDPHFPQPTRCRLWCPISIRDFLRLCRTKANSTGHPAGCPRKIRSKNCYGDQRCQPISIPLSSCIKITLNTTDLRPTAKLSSNPSWINLPVTVANKPQSLRR